MLAIFYSGQSTPGKAVHSTLQPLRRIVASACQLLYWAIILIGFLTATALPAISADTNVFAARAAKIYHEAKDRLAAHPADDEAAWQLGRACYDWADFATSSRQREQIAKEGIAACRQLVERNPSSALGYYYLAMDSGQLARTESLGALKLVTQMEIDFKTALRLDPKLDYAGPERNLGLLYHQAPGWPLSLGSRTKARQYLQAALTRAPHYPENILNLAEAEMEWNEKANVQRHLRMLDDLWPTAKTKFTGEAWASSWVDWTDRRDDLRKKLTAAPKDSRRGGAE